MSEHETVVISDEEMLQIREAGYNAPYPKIHICAFGAVVKIDGRWHHVDIKKTGIDVMRLPQVTNRPDLVA